MFGCLMMVSIGLLEEPVISQRRSEHETKTRTVLYGVASTEWTSKDDL